MISGRTLVYDDECTKEGRAAGSPPASLQQHLKRLPEEFFSFKQNGGYEVKRAVDGEHPLENFEKAVEGHRQARVYCRMHCRA